MSIGVESVLQKIEMKFGGGSSMQKLPWSILPQSWKGCHQEWQVEAARKECRHKHQEVACAAAKDGGFV